VPAEAIVEELVRATVEELVRATVLAAPEVEERTALEVVMSRVAVVVVGTEMPLGAGLEVIAGRAHVPAAAAARPAWDLEVAAVAVEVVDDAGKRGTNQVERINRSTEMKSTSANDGLSGRSWVASAVALFCLCTSGFLVAQQTQVKATPAASSSIPAGTKTFDSPQQAADALVNAAGQFDTTALTEIFGPEGDNIVFTGDTVQDRQRATDFASEAREKKSVSVEPKNGARAFLLVGNEDWPFPVPIVKKGSKWFFDSKAGKQELLNRRIGANELDAISICHGYVEAQEEYAMQKREGYQVAQYAQRIISTPGKQDGLTWRNDDGTVGGPIGEKIAQAIAQGYSSKEEPYHGYFFKVLKGQGPAAPLGQLDYVIEGAMIGGFALVAAPAEYRVTGVKTFIVSNDGVVYEKDLGPGTLDAFKKMERFNPDKTWTPVQDDED